MSSVSLVCTVHEPLGRANVSELLAILERIQPEVIFLEVPPAAFDDHYENCSRQNLESMAVRQYREGRPVRLVPVDLPTPAREFFENHDQMRETIRAESAEFRQLLASERAHVRAYGFSYLNSEHYSKLTADLDAEMLRTIKRLGNCRLVEIFESGKEKDDLREKAMMENIQKYCRENTFDKGVFLVGAAHRRAIIDISRTQSAMDSTRIQWDFSGHLARWDLIAAIRGAVR
jgi:hypothetical protein